MLLPIAGFSYSSDEGKSWVIPLNPEAQEGFNILPLRERTNIFLGGAGMCGLCDQGGVYLSTNSGDQLE